MANILTHINITIAATSANQVLPLNVVSILAKARSTNAGTAYFQIDEQSANSTTGSSLVAGESKAIDLSQNIAAKIIAGEKLTADNFMRFISTIGTAGDIIELDVISWV